MSENAVSDHDAAYKKAIDNAKARYQGMSAGELWAERKKLRERASGPTLFGNTHEYVASCEVIYDLLQIKST